MRLLPLITILLAVIGIALALTIGAMSGACAGDVLAAPQCEDRR